MVNLADALFLLAAVVALVGAYLESSHVSVQYEGMSANEASFYRRHTRAYKICNALSAVSMALFILSVAAFQIVDWHSSPAEWVMVGTATVLLLLSALCAARGVREFRV